MIREDLAMVGPNQVSQKDFAQLNSENLLDIGGDFKPIQKSTDGVMKELAMKKTAIEDYLRQITGKRAINVKTFSLEPRDVDRLEQGLVSKKDWLEGWRDIPDDFIDWLRDGDIVIFDMKAIADAYGFDKESIKDPKGYESILIILNSLVYEIGEKIKKLGIGGEFQEIFKNALVHGNAWDTTQPVYIFIEWDQNKRIRKLHFIDMELKDEGISRVFIQANYDIYMGLTGQGVGRSKVKERYGLEDVVIPIKQLHGSSPRDVVIDYEKTANRAMVTTPVQQNSENLTRFRKLLNNSPKRVTKVILDSLRKNPGDVNQIQLFLTRGTEPRLLSMQQMMQEEPDDDRGSTYLYNAQSGVKVVFNDNTWVRVALTITPDLILEDSTKDQEIAQVLLPLIMGKYGLVKRNQKNKGSENSAMMTDAEMGQVLDQNVTAEQRGKVLADLVQGNPEIRRSIIEMRKNLPYFNTWAGYSIVINGKQALDLDFLLGKMTFFDGKPTTYDFYGYHVPPKNRELAFGDFLALQVSAGGDKRGTVKELLEEKGLLKFMENGLPIERAGAIIFDKSQRKIKVEDQTIGVTIFYNQDGSIIKTVTRRGDAFGQLSLSREADVLDFHFHPGDEYFSPSVGDMETMIRKNRPELIMNSSGHGAIWVIKDLERARELMRSPNSERLKSRGTAAEIRQQLVEPIFNSTPVDLHDSAMLKIEDSSPLARQPGDGAKTRGIEKASIALNGKVRPYVPSDDTATQVFIFSDLENAQATGAPLEWKRFNGGIDLNPAQMSMQVKKEGEDFKFDFNGTEIDAAQVIGVTFTIRR